MNARLLLGRSRARRLFAILVLAGVFQAGMPRPVFAIWGGLDRLSGAGSWEGPQVDFRLACFFVPADSDSSRKIIPGIETSCPIDTDTGKKPAASISLGVRFFKADADPQYAGNAEIRLVTLVPSFSFSVFATKPKADFLDVGIGAGAYWFSSEGFTSLSGVIVEPMRLDLHVPPGLVPLDWKGALAQAVMFRYGWVIFPDGFEADAFKGTGDKARRIPAEGLRAWSVFLNLAPLVHLGD